MSAVARPQFLDLETTPVSESIKRIVEFINANPKCTRRKLIEALAPTPKPTVIEITDTPTRKAKLPPHRLNQPRPKPTPEQTAVIVDLHWLVHQGDVLEFADGRLETAKKPAPRPPKPEKKVAVEKPAAAAGEAATATENIPAAEVAAELATEVSAPV